MENDNELARLEQEYDPKILRVKVTIKLPRFVKRFGIKPYLRNITKPVYNSKNSNLSVGLDYQA